VGGRLGPIAIDPQNPAIIYLGADVGVFKSKDGGASWNHAGLEGFDVRALIIDPRQPTILYAHAVRAVYDVASVFKSTDGGASWNESDSGLPVCCINKLAIDPQNSVTLYILSNSDQGLFKSTDAGASWTPANYGLPPVPVFAFAIDPKKPSTLYAGTEFGVFKSDDGGSNWRSANSGLPLVTLQGPLGEPVSRYVSVDSLVIDPQNPSTVYAVASGFVDGSITGVTVVYARGGLFKSSDGGGSWNPAGLVLPESLASDRIILTIDPRNPSTLYAGTYYGIFKSTDGGASWSPLNSGLPPFEVETLGSLSFHADSVVDSVVIDPQQPATVYATISNSSGRSLFKTTDGGASWSDASSGLPGGTHFGFLTIDAQNPATLYTASTSTTELWEFAADGAVRSMLYMGSSSTTGLGGVFKSTDGGTTWTAASSGLRAIGFSALAIGPQNPSTLYASTTVGLLKTTDNGATWSVANWGLPMVDLSRVAIDPQNASTIFVNASADGHGATWGVYKSTDGGASWSPSWVRSLDDCSLVGALAVDPRNSYIVYAITGNNDDECGDDAQAGRLRKSVDGGVTWSASLLKDLGISSSYVSVLVIDPQRPANLYAASVDGGVFKSTDAGASWSPANSGLTDKKGSCRAVALAIDPRNSSTLYAVSSRGSSCGVFKSNDAGASWNLASSGLPPLPINAALLTVDPTNPDRVYLGAYDSSQIFKSAVFKSADGGESWTDAGLAVYGEWTGGLAVSSQVPSTVYATTPEGLFAMNNIPRFRNSWGRR
jgi:photosystem II stability/assembly factor-like uncharacterized protein